MMKDMKQERGSVLTLGIGLFVIVVAICSIGADVCSVWVTRHGLDSVADGAALSAAQAVDEAYVYQHGLGTPVHLSQSLARKRVASYVVAAHVKSRFPGFRIRSVTVTSTRVEVEFQSLADVPFGYLMPAGATYVRAAASAKLDLK